MTKARSTRRTLPPTICANTSRSNSGLVAGPHSVDAYLGPAHGGLKGAKALVHAIEFLLLDRPPIEVPTDRISQSRGLLLQTPDVVAECVFDLQRRIELPGCLLSQLLDAAQHLFGAGDLPVAIVQPLNL